MRIVVRRTLAGGLLLVASLAMLPVGPAQAQGFVFEAFDAFAERVRRADRERLPPGTMPAFLIAAFHPGGTETFTFANARVTRVEVIGDPARLRERDIAVLQLGR